MVSTGTIIVLLLNAILGIAFPVLLVWWAVKKHDAKLSTILIGAGTFVVFALVLEPIVHRIVLTGPHGATIMGNIWYYGVYGGLMAGLFEETGRYLSMRFLLKNESSDLKPAISFGIGHGGMEMIVLFALTMVFLFVLAILVNTGQVDTLLSKAPREAQAQLTAQIEQLKSAAAGSYFFGLWERISALILHMSLSTLVWIAVRKGGKWRLFFPAAILLHALVDTLAVHLSKVVDMFTMEMMVSLLAFAMASMAWLVALKAQEV